MYRSLKDCGTGLSTGGNSLNPLKLAAAITEVRTEELLNTETLSYHNVTFGS
jgi:hypothetical protein